MPEPRQFILGEHRRTLDQRSRVSIPSPWAELLTAESADCVLAKERPGCLSLWSSAGWQEKLDERVELIERKMHLGELEKRISQVQMLGRLLSTRHILVQLAGRGRLLIPEGFREFLAAESDGKVMVVGAAVCVEIWNATAWVGYLEGRMPKFRRLFDRLSR